MKWCWHKWVLLFKGNVINDTRMQTVKICRKCGEKRTVEKIIDKEERQ